MAVVIFDLPFHLREITINMNQIKSVCELKLMIVSRIIHTFGTLLDFYLIHNGKLLDCTQIPEGKIYVCPRLYGGKGGFGSMLRAIGAQIEKTTNREACRDLSGRRLRDINEEQRLKKWIAGQAEREQEALKRKRKKLEKLNKIVKHDFVDDDYTKARLEMPEKIHESVEEGLKATSEAPSCSSKVVENKETNIKSKKKIKGDLWLDNLESSEWSESDSEEDEESPKKKLRLS